MTANEIIRQKVTAFRKAHNLTQEQMALLIGVSTSHYRLIEKGIGNPTAKTEDKIAKAMGIPVSKLLEGDGEGCGDEKQLSLALSSN